MSDFNPLDRAKIPTHRSSFDLSSKKLFTAKVGEILPCYWQIAIPDTKYRISPTLAVNSFFELKSNEDRCVAILARSRGLKSLIIN